eukprot:gene1215-32556_t
MSRGRGQNGPEAGPQGGRALTVGVGTRSETNKGGLKELVDDYYEGNIQNCLKEILDQDLKKIGSPSLPDDVNRATSSSIKGPCVLQVVSIEDAYKPKAKDSVGEVEGKRLLVVHLTDGKVTCKALEFRHIEVLQESDSVGEVGGKRLLVALEFRRIEGLQDSLPPGTKLCLTGAQIRMGVVQMEPKNVKVLGGHVADLVEAWEVQRMYGGLERPKGTGEEAAMGPTFKKFIPGKDNLKGIPRGAAAAAAAAAATAKQAGAAQGTAPGSSAVSAALSGAVSHTGLFAIAKEGEVDEKVTPKRAPVDVAPAKLTFNRAAPGNQEAKQKLLEKMANNEETGRFGRGGGRGGRGRGRGRRGRDYDDDEDDGAMTLEEYEEMQKAKKASLGKGMGMLAVPKSQLQKDEEMARQLQEQMDAEDRRASAAAAAAASSQAPAPRQAFQDRTGPSSTDLEVATGGGRGLGGGRGGGRGFGGGAGHHVAESAQPGGRGYGGGPGHHVAESAQPGGRGYGGGPGHHVAESAQPGGRGFGGGPGHHVAESAQPGGRGFGGRSAGRGGGRGAPHSGGQPGQQPTYGSAPLPVSTPPAPLERWCQPDNQGGTQGGPPPPPSRASYGQGFDTQGGPQSRTASYGQGFDTQGGPQGRSASYGQGFDTQGGPQARSANYGQGFDTQGGPQGPPPPYSSGGPRGGQQRPQSAHPGPAASYTQETVPAHQQHGGRQRPQSAHPGQGSASQGSQAQPSQSGPGEGTPPKGQQQAASAVASALASRAGRPGPPAAGSQQRPESHINGSKQPGSAHSASQDGAKQSANPEAQKPASKSDTGNAPDAPSYGNAGPAGNAAPQKAPKVNLGSRLAALALADSLSKK